MVVGCGEESVGFGWAFEVEEGGGEGAVKEGGGGGG